MKRRDMTRVITGGIVAIVCLATPATGQYFGQNKVQYDDMDWKVVSTEHLDLHFYPETEVASMQMARAAERWHWRLSRVFDHRLTERKPVVMYANHPDFQQTNIVRGEIGLGTGGVTDALRNRATQPYTGDFHSTAHVVGHELAHVFQYDIADAGPGIRAMGQLPLWLIEGMAEYLSVGRVDPHTAMWLRDAVIRGDIPTIAGLSSGRYFPYRYGQALMAYIGGRWGDDAVTRLYRVALRDGLRDAITEVTGLTHEQLSREWAEELRTTYLPQVQDREAPEDVGRPLLADQSSSNMNLSPVLSPDGSMVAFISERGLFSMNIYVADVESGEIIRQLTSTEREPHFDALNFLESAGTWSPDGRYFAYVVVDDGDNEIRIADVRRGRGVRSVEIDAVSALNDPEWSPDGRRIVFSGSSSGISDLWVYDLETEQATQLTNDLHAELHPSWSPDGRTLVFATDRGPETDMDALEFGALRLATMDIDSRRIQLLPAFPGAKHIDPHFSPDGRSIYFVSDRDGVSDIFRLETATQRFYRITRAATGISGITGHSPAMTLSARTGRLAFSIFKDNRYTLHALDGGALPGDPVSGPGDVFPAGVLPPVDAARPGSGNMVNAYLEAPLDGLPRDVTGFVVADYDPDLSLDYIGPPALGVASNQFGTQISGAVSFFFGDLLGNRRLAVLAQAQGELADAGAQVYYENRENRINWALLGARVPYRSARRGVEQVNVGGNDAVVVRTQIFRTYANQAGGRFEYPFSRTRRAELGGSYTLYTFDAEEQRLLCDPAGRNCERMEDVPLEDLERDAVSIAQTSAAYVGDWANFGFTGPVAGGRYRFEAQPTFGDFQFTAALADFRRYYFWNPLTLAVRGLHYGRYGQDSENTDFMSPIFLGSGGIVRGYSINSFRTSECSGVNGGIGCPEFDRLVGSRIGVAGMELRVPLLGTPNFGLLSFPLLPTTIGAFFDMGVAWTADEAPVLEFKERSTERIPVASAGFLARFNVLGYVILDTWLAHPFQRPEKNWEFGFQLAPGW